MLKTNIFPYICSVSPSAPQWFFELSNGLLMTQKIMAGFLVLHTGKSAFIDMYKCPLDFYDVLKQFELYDNSSQDLRVFHWSVSLVNENPFPPSVQFAGP